MASFSIVIAQPRSMNFRRPPFRRQINKRIFKLKKDPRPGDAELILESEHYRVLVGAWWIIFRLDDAKQVVEPWTARTFRIRARQSGSIDRA